MLYVSHALEEVLSLCDTVTVLKDGRHIQTTPAATQTPDTLVTAMLGRSMDLVFPPQAPPPSDAPVVPCGLAAAGVRGRLVRRPGRRSSGWLGSGQRSH